MYVTKRGRSPRVVKASVLGTSGASAASGWTLRNKLGLRDSWFWVRSMSVSPVGSDATTIVYGEKATLSGRTYPAIGTGKRVDLHYYRDGVWKTTRVSLARTQKKTFTYVVGGSSKTGSYTSYSFAAGPGRTTTYYFAYGKSRSPKTIVRVRPAAHHRRRAPSRRRPATRSPSRARCCL